MKCKFCKSPEKLKWPENWKKGIKPINAETGLPHICESQKSEKPANYYCSQCSNQNQYCENLKCIDCKVFPSFCVNCNTHPQVSNVR